MLHFPSVKTPLNRGFHALRVSPCLFRWQLVIFTVHKSIRGASLSLSLACYIVFCVIVTVKGGPAASRRCGCLSPCSGRGAAGMSTLRKNSITGNIVIFARQEGRPRRPQTRSVVKAPTTASRPRVPFCSAMRARRRPCRFYVPEEMADAHANDAEQRSGRESAPSPPHAPWSLRVVQNAFCLALPEAAVSGKALQSSRHPAVQMKMAVGCLRS